MAKEYRNEYLCRGNMVAAPEQTTFGKNSVKTTARMATHKINGRGETIPTFVRCDWWNGEGDVIMALDLKKGDFVELKEAEYYNTKKEGKDGKTNWYQGFKGGTIAIYVDPDDVEEDASSELPFEK